MIIESLTLNNWRGYRERHCFRFDSGFNLVTGRNEAGKSTLFEAMTRVLFDRHNSRAEEIRRIQPLGSSLSPEAELTFYANGNRYRVTKRFLEQPSSTLYMERGGRWELDHEGDRADQELRNVLQGESAGRATKPEHRGLAQALWYLQYEQPLPERTWAESIKQGIAGLVEQVTESPQESRISEAIRKVYSADFTPTGRVASRSESNTLREEIETDGLRLKELLQRSEHVETLRTDLEELSARRSEVELALKQAKSDLTTLSEDLEIADAVEEQRQQKEMAIQSADQALRKLSNDLDTVERRLKEIHTCNITLNDAQGDSEQYEADARQELLAKARHHKKWSEEYEPALQNCETELRILQALERLRRLSRDRERLENHLSRVHAAEEELQEAKQELANLYAPSEEDLRQFQNNLSALRVVEGQLSASAIRIAFRFDDPALVIEVKPEAQRAMDSDEYLVLVPTSFRIQDVGEVAVRGGGSSIEELNVRAAELRSKIDDTLQSFGATDAQAVSDLRQHRINLDAKVERLQTRLGELANEWPNEDPTEELARVAIGIRQESEVSGDAPDEWKAWGGQRIREGITTREDNKNRLIGLIKEEQSYEEKTNQANLESLRKTQEASNKVAGLRSRIKSIEQENTESLKTYGTVDHLCKLVEPADSGLKQAKLDLEQVLQDYEAKVEIPRRLHQQNMESVKTLELKITEISSGILDRKARIEEAAAQGLYSQTADLEAALETKRRRLETVQRRSEAAKLLWEMVIAFRSEMSAALAVPVATLVNNWLALLTDDTYESLHLDGELLPVSVKNRRYGEALPFESLSYGTHEQFIVLVRLAMGVLLSNGERNLVVIDDRLVNADSIRMKRLCLILEEASSKNCQLVVATCDETRYSGISGNVIRVPDDGREP